MMKQIIDNKIIYYYNKEKYILIDYNDKFIINIDNIKKINEILIDKISK